MGQVYTAGITVMVSSCIHKVTDTDVINDNKILLQSSPKEINKMDFLENSIKPLFQCQTCADPVRQKPNKVFRNNARVCPHTITLTILWICFIVAHHLRFES